MIAEGNGGADRAADLVLLDGIAGCESWVLHRVGGEDPVAVHRGFEDGGRDMDLRGVFVFGERCVADDSRDHRRFGGCAGDHDDAPLWSELVEDERHDRFEEFAFVDDARGD